MKTIPFRIMVITGLAAAFITQCSKSSSGNTPDNGGDSTGTGATVRQIVFADQSVNRVVIADVDTKQVVWEWQPAQAGVAAGDVKWFVNMSDAKPVYNNRYILANASAGGVALIRIADKKTVFYGYAGNGNIHSAEVLPDGNLVIAASTGSYLMLMKMDTTANPYSGYTKKVTVADAHNVVWDKKRQVLWTASGNKLYAFTYNFNCAAPDLTLTDSLTLPASGSHDLFPLYGKDSLWLSTSSKVWSIDLTKRTVTGQCALPRVKSVSNGPSDKYPAILMQSIDTDQQWYNDKVIDLKGNTVFQLNGLKAYKGRWFLNAGFSYDDNAVVKVCK
ncbi:hypothetical protein A3860_12235 [Niastella vici]|uniref:Uncharacterized protein n=1 Tax=Niastella vici TaxID=1703345 RepID=A0A1V9G725_9BACT|nr:DUF6528 family protein [Niastella vici]OQP66266.1 hypothetical protein A3860_12235 [Niastella vici]